MTLNSVSKPIDFKDSSFREKKTLNIWTQPKQTIIRNTSLSSPRKQLDSILAAFDPLYSTENNSNTYSWTSAQSTIKQIGDLSIFDQLPISNTQKTETPKITTKEITAATAIRPNDELIKEPVYKRERGNLQVLSPKMALDLYKPYFSVYEYTEILSYSAIYSVGSYAQKISTTDINYYDDLEGNYKAIMRDHINYRYEIIGEIGQGTFGQVVKCRDMKRDEIVAIKIVKKDCDASVEIKILEKLMQKDPHHRNFIIQVLEHFMFRGHTCIVFECLSLDLFQALKKNGFEGFPLGVVKRFAYQLLKAVKLLGDNNIIHCDLKPENILLKHPDKSGIRLIDFGTSCFANETAFTYIQSRFYRAPEILLGAEYGLPIDMWSTGCVIAELFTGSPLFPGKDNLDQFACIVQTVGLPDPKILKNSKRSHVYFDAYGKPRMRKSKKKRSCQLDVILTRYDGDILCKDFVDFISRCITWNPEKRMTPKEALEHPWIRS